MNGATYKKVRICAGSGRRYRDNSASVAVRRQLTSATGTDVSSYEWGNVMEMEMEWKMYLNPAHNSRTRGVSSKQTLVRVSRKTYEYCCLRRDDVHVINLLRTVILLSPPLNPK